MYKIVQFSPTGNSAYLAKTLKNYLPVEEVLALEHTDASQMKCEHLIIFYPIHAFNPPKVVVDFVKHINETHISKVSFIAVGCNTAWLNDGVSKPLRKICESKKIDVIVDDIMEMPLSFVMSFPEDLIREQLKKANETLPIIASHIENEKKTCRRKSFKSDFVHALGKGEKFAAKFFGLELYSKKTCIKCGLCQRECPTHNIVMKDKVKFGFKCMMCMRCIYKCPTSSIQPRISKFIPAKGGYSINKYLD